MTRASAFAVKVHTRSADENGILLLLDGRLAAVLVELQDPVHGDDVGRWSIEALFGASGGGGDRTFATPAEAFAQAAERVGGRPAALPDEIPALGYGA